jgi:hypothetical protein
VLCARRAHAPAAEARFVRPHERGRDLRFLHRVTTVALVLVLLASAYFGFAAGPNILRAAHTPLQWLATGTELLYAVAAVGALWLIYREDRRQGSVLVLFMVAVTTTTGLAPTVWGRAGWGTGVISAAVAALLVGGLIGTRQLLAARIQHAATRAA